MNAWNIAWIYIIGGGTLVLIGGVLAGYGWKIMPQKGNQTAQQITINNYFQLKESSEAINKMQLKQKYPLGYAVFAANDINIHIPQNFNYGKEFETDWENAKVSSLTSESIVIDLPNIFYKPLNTSIIGISIEVPRKVGSQIQLPLKFKGQEIIPIIEIVEDRGTFVVLVLGFKSK